MVLADQNRCREKDRLQRNHSVRNMRGKGSKCFIPDHGLVRTPFCEPSHTDPDKVMLPQKWAMLPVPIRVGPIGFRPIAESFAHCAR